MDDDVLFVIAPAWSWSDDGRRSITQDQVEFAKALAAAADEYRAEVERLYTLEAFYDSDEDVSGFDPAA